MQCQVSENYDVTSENSSNVLLSTKAFLMAVFRPSLPTLPLESMSDHIKRDLGFLDGRGSWNDPDLCR